MAKEIIKKTISDAQLKNELIKLFESGNTSKTNLYELIRTTYKIGKQRCLNMFDTAYLEWQKTKEQATKEQIQANAVEGLKIGLKSKLERQLEIQAEIMDLQQKLINNTTKDVFIDFKKGVPKNYERNLTPGEIAQYKRTIAILNVELSKMAGDYAPSKVDAKIDGNLTWIEQKVYEAK